MIPSVDAAFGVAPSLASAVAPLRPACADGTNG